VTVTTSATPRATAFGRRLRSLARPAAAWLLVLALAGALRFAFPSADPPWRSTVGIVWHDEGAWVHNARNKALFGTWRTDEWNPIFIAPVFTGLEYLSFQAFGVGVVQARVVSMAMGLLSVALAGFGVMRLAGRRAGLMAAALLGANYFYVMWNRAALMEATMTSLLVAAWYCVARAERQAAWGLGAAAAAWLAYYTKAASAFFVVGLAIVAAAALADEWRAARARAGRPSWRAGQPRAAIWILAGLAAVGALIFAVFVWPFRDEYVFYNWQMSVLRKPAYTVRAIVDRVSWFPIIHDVFTRSLFITVVGAIALVGWCTRLARAGLAERTIVAWIGVGVLELFVHDVGNERRFLFLIPPLAILTAVALGRDGTLWTAGAVTLARRWRLALLPVIALAGYVVAGALLRLVSIYTVKPGVRASAAAAVALTAVVFAAWPAVARWLSHATIGPRAAVLIVACVVAGDLLQYVQWAAGRTYENVEASRALGERLPPGTLVHGKLANGLALENRIRPVFVGKGFGNYDDRLDRPDVRYILTYISPRVGYEGPVILDILGAYPARRIVWTFEVAETSSGRDRAALIVKQPPPVQADGVPAAGR
jgi:4-amino-4-deoxy-L-arabinose transferase-like glycosyltransferase